MAKITDLYAQYRTEVNHYCQLYEAKMYAFFPLLLVSVIGKMKVN